jgi:hypothetical protein
VIYRGMTTPTLLEEIQNEWAKDSKVDETEVGRELLRTNRLHEKYIRYMATGSLLAKQRAGELDKLRAVKWDYYSGRMSKEELDDRGWKPYLYASPSKDYIERCLAKDDDLIDLTLRFALATESYEVAKAIVKEIGQRHYSLGKWVDYQKFLQGH